MALTMFNLRPKENGFSGWGQVGADILQEQLRKQQNAQNYQQILGLNPETAQSLSQYDLPQVMELIQALGQRQGGLESLTGLGGQQQGRQPQMIGQQPTMGMPEQMPMGQPQPGVSQPLSVAQALGKPTKAQDREERKLALKERQVMGGEERAAEELNLKYAKAIQPYMDKTFDRASEAEETIEVMNRMKELEEAPEGITSEAWNEFLNGFGLGIPTLFGGPSEEFIKLRQGFIKGAREAYGGKVSNFELQEFMKALPDLSNSPEGRKRIKANIERTANLQIKEAEVASEIIEENPKITPNKLRSEVAKRMKSERKEASNKFKEDLEKPVPKGSSPWLTAAARLAGKGTRLATGAGLGFLAGGPLGAAVGGGTAAFGPSILDSLKGLG